MNGVPVVGPAVTDAQGIATIPYTIQNIGTYTIFAEFLQDSIYAASNNTNNLVVSLTPTSLVVNSVNGFKEDKVDLIATLTDTHKNVPLGGKIVKFSVGGTEVGQGTTDASGKATYLYTITQSTNIYTILATFLGDTPYAATSSTNNLEVNHLPTSMTVNTARGFKGDIVDLTVKLSDIFNNVPLSDKNINFM